MGIDNLKNIAIIIGACVTISTGLWFFTKPTINKHIEDQIEIYIKSDVYNIQQTKLAKEIAKDVFKEFLDSKEFTTLLDGYLNQANSNSVSLRKLLSLKMGVPQESVADRLAELYTKDRKRLRKLLREINKMYPELNVWEIE